MNKLSKFIPVLNFCWIEFKIRGFPMLEIKSLSWLQSSIVVLYATLDKNRNVALTELEKQWFVWPIYSSWSPQNQKISHEFVQKEGVNFMTKQCKWRTFTKLPFCVCGWVRTEAGLRQVYLCSACHGRQGFQYYWGKNVNLVQSNWQVTSYLASLRKIDAEALNCKLHPKLSILKLE